jgi:hypothetical protein
MKTKEIRKNLLEALEKATFVTAGFGFTDNKLDYDCKNETRLFRETWLIPPIIEALRLVDPCKTCGGTGWMYLHVFNFSKTAGLQTTIKCESCNDTGISGGLPFDPYERSREAVEKAHNMKVAIAHIDQM